MRFVLPLPPSTNNLFKNAGKKRVKSDSYKAWINEAWWMLKEDVPRQTLPVAPYKLDVWCYFGDRRKRDADNYNKGVQDLLADFFGFEDELVVDACQHKRYDKENPRCVVYLGHAEEDGEG